MIKVPGRNKLQTLTPLKKKNYIKYNMGRDEKKKGKVKDRTVASCVHISLLQDHTYKYLRKKTMPYICLMQW